MKPLHWEVLIALVGAVSAIPSTLHAQKKEDAIVVGQPSIADSALTQDVWRLIGVWEMATPNPAGCTAETELGARVIAEVPKDGNPRKHPWVEHWTVRRCETEDVYRVSFTPARGGTEFQIAPLKR